MSDETQPPPIGPPRTAEEIRPYTLREPDSYQHRMFKGPDTDIDLHVLSLGCLEINRMVMFRDWQRSNASDRDLYAHTKLALAAQDWKYVQNCADAETAVIEEILARARAGRK